MNDSLDELLGAGGGGGGGPLLHVEMLQRMWVSGEQRVELAYSGPGSLDDLLRQRAIAGCGHASRDAAFGRTERWSC